MIEKIIAIWVVVALAPCAAGAGPAVTVETIDLRLLRGELVSLTDKVLVLRSDGESIIVPRKHLAEVVLAESKNLLSIRAQSVIVTTRGHHLSVSKLRLAEERLSFDNPLLGHASMPLNRVSAVYCPPLSLSTGDLMRRCREMKLRAKAADVLVVEKTKSKGAGKDADKDADKSADKIIKGLVAIRGAMKGITGGPEAKVLFQWRGKDRQVSLKSVRAILLADTAGGSQTASVGVLTGRCGSMVEFSDISLAGGKKEFSVTTSSSSSADAATVSPLRVASIRFTSPSVVELSSLKPVAVREHGFFDRKFPHRLNRSVAGGPIRLAGRTYRSGLGLHSFSELTYALNGKYARFVAVVGIDDAVRPAGKVDLTILADGKLLVEKVSVTGKDKPLTLRLDVTGAAKLTIRVGFGVDRLDVSDHLDLAAARLLPPEK